MGGVLTVWFRRTELKTEVLYETPANRLGAVLCLSSANSDGAWNNLDPPLLLSAGLCFHARKSVCHYPSWDQFVSSSLWPLAYGASGSFNADPIKDRADRALRSGYAANFYCGGCRLLLCAFGCLSLRPLWGRAAIGSQDELRRLSVGETRKGTAEMASQAAPSSQHLHVRRAVTPSGGGRGAAFPRRSI